MKVIVVPGGLIVPLNKMGESFLIRCEAALKLFGAGNYDFILTTGGLTHPRNVQYLPEAYIARSWLVDKGVPKEKIIMEDKSLDSFGNIELGLKILKKRNIEPEEITVVSQWQHAIRYWITLRLGHHVSAKIRLHMLHPKIKLKESLIEWAYIFYHLLDPLGKGILVKKQREFIRNKRRKD